MMVVFEEFVFAAPPYTGTDWFLSAAKTIELSYWYIEGVYTPPHNTDKFFLSIVRHPYFWLKEVFFSSKNSICPLRHDEDLLSLAMLEQDLGGFIHRCVRVKNRVWDVFKQYRASSILRFEDFPEAPIEFFESLGVGPEKIQTIKSIKVHVGQYRNVSIDEEGCLMKEVLQAEPRFCEAYNYY